MVSGWAGQQDYQASFLHKASFVSRDMCTGFSTKSYFERGQMKDTWDWVFCQQGIKPFQIAYRVRGGYAVFA